MPITRLCVLLSCGRHMLTLHQQNPRRHEDFQMLMLYYFDNYSTVDKNVVYQPLCIAVYFVDSPEITAKKTE